MENMSMRINLNVHEILRHSRKEAKKHGNCVLNAEYVFWGILCKGEGNAINTLQELGLNLKNFKESIEQATIKSGQTAFFNPSNTPSEATENKLFEAIAKEVKLMNNRTATSIHLLLAILRDQSCLTTQMLLDQNINYDKVKKKFEEISLKTGGFSSNLLPFGDEHEKSNTSRTGGNENLKKKSDTPALDSFGTDITKMAEDGMLDPIVGRESEIERLAQILSRRKKNNPILIGEAGVGKSAIAEGLALRIAQKRVSRILFGKRVVSLDVASIVAGTKFRGQFEERMKVILQELLKNRNVILFIDEIHTIVGAGTGGASGALDVANMLKPALSRGEIQCIGATTLDEYRQNIEKDGALERRFQKLMVEPTSPEETVKILNNIKQRYEDHHQVYYTENAIQACVNLSSRYISDRCFPDKAIDALDEAGSRVHISSIHVPKTIEDLEKKIEIANQDKIKAVKVQDFEKATRFRDEERMLKEKLAEETQKWTQEISLKKEKVSEEEVAEVIAMMTGVPVKRIAQAEGSRLLQMNAELQSKIIGQDEAIAKIVKAIQRNRAGLKDPDKPIGTFIFLGPTGVGKTQLAKILSEYLFDSSDALIRIDMSEYMEKFTVSRLVGAPPGYVGYEEGGQLTEKVRRKPYSVVLLDEIEKAHPDVFNILLQLLDEGQLTDSLGRKVDFRNCIVIMTSNIGSRELKEFGQGIGFQSSSNNAAKYANHVVEKALRKAFAPEFLNRIDDLIMFNSLSKENIHQIIDLELKGLYQRISNLGYQIEISDTAKDFITEKGYDVKFGARPLKRAIQKYIENEIAEVIIKMNVSQGDTILVDINDKNEITTEIAMQTAMNQQNA